MRGVMSLKPFTPSVFGKRIGAELYGVGAVMPLVPSPGNQLQACS